MKRLILGFVTALCGVCVAAASALPVDFDRGVTVALTLPDARLAERRVTGVLVRMDDAGVTLDTDSGRRTVAWNDASPESLFVARLLAAGEPATADGWLEMAAFARDVGARPQAELAARRATRLDATRSADAQAALARPLGSLRDEAVAPPAAPPDDAADDADASPSLPAPPDARAVVDDLPPKFAKVNPGTAQEAERLAEREAREAADKLGLNLRMFRTPHFLVFTDWEVIDDAWMADQLEAAYALLAREFHVRPDDTVFVGRLPVYMFDDADAMMRYAREVDGLNAPGHGHSVAGYHASRGGGLNKLVMSKPRATRDQGLPAARRQWSRTLTHEFVHAFLARYRGERLIPRWMNEGLAEILAENAFPRDYTNDYVRDFARSGRTLEAVFDDLNMPGGEYYPVMMSLTKALYDKDPGRFVHMVDRIKAGDPAEATLKTLFGLDYAGLEHAWREHHKR